MKLATIMLLVLGALPLLIYPFVLVASVMGIAAPRSANQAALSRLAYDAFMWGTISYPLVYLAFGIPAILLLQKNRLRAALAVALGPLAFLLLLGGLFIAMP